jgi:hypothetical protein
MADDSLNLFLASRQFFEARFGDRRRLVERLDLVERPHLVEPLDLVERLVG